MLSWLTSAAFAIIPEQKLFLTIIASHRHRSCLLYGASGNPATSSSVTDLYELPWLTGFRAGRRPGSGFQLNKGGGLGYGWTRSCLDEFHDCFFIFTLFPLTFVLLLAYAISERYHDGLFTALLLSIY